VRRYIYMQLQPYQYLISQYAPQLIFGISGLFIFLFWSDYPCGRAYATLVLAKGRPQKLKLEHAVAHVSAFEEPFWSVLPGTHVERALTRHTFICTVFFKRTTSQC
jgi:hypothetical protein